MSIATMYMMLMNPPKSGPVDGPMNGAKVKMAIGACMVLRGNKSPTVPPDTDRNALPAKPWKKRAMIIVWIFCATADAYDPDHVHEEGN